jgi:CheY-like chemotaxis protein
MRGSSDARLRAIPAIGLTGYEAARRELMEAGACEALAKPCSEAVLLERVASALRGAA